MSNPRIYTKQEAEAKRIVEQAAYPELMALQYALNQANAKLALFDRMRKALRAVENSGWSQAWLTELLAEADALAEEEE